jgi:hypothetical protein
MYQSGQAMGKKNALFSQGGGGLGAEVNKNLLKVIFYFRT